MFVELVGRLMLNILQLFKKIVESSRGFPEITE